MAATKPSNPKPKPFTFSCILFLISLTFITLCYLKRLECRHSKPSHIAQLPENPKWFDVIAREIGHDHINVGLVNINGKIESFHTRGKIVEVGFDQVDESIQWSDLYPEWIDENGTPNCSDVPMPNFEEYGELDVMVARVEEERGSRDVFRLQVNLIVANLLVRSGRNSSDEEGNVFVVFIGSIEPMWEIFRCDDVFFLDDNLWVYKPHLQKMKTKVAMPLGSCQIGSPLPEGDELQRPAREAYVTVLHSSESYVCGAIVLAQSILQSNSTKDLILLADNHLSPKSIFGLKSAGWEVRRITRIRNPHSSKESYNEWNYSKLRIWQLTDYDKVIFIDADLLVTGNLDRLFNYPQLSAAGNDLDRFNSGVMVIEPSECSFRRLMRKRYEIRSYNGGDQGFLNEMFRWWHRLPRRVNQLKFYGENDDRGAEEEVEAVHYLGMKPWMCYKDYDCNWDWKFSRQFASDAVNEKWWRVYDTMAGRLQGYCDLTWQMEQRIWEHRKQARNERFPDEHWNVKITDSRARTRRRWNQHLI